ncbi:MAG: DUF3288 family protein [Chloroflexaceae bacterium]|nr:DUF3288 family protein [Chloroflexaceae bacterium]
MAATPQDQKHPQETSDRQAVNHLLREPPTPQSWLELARLRIRYQNFPGARDIQRDLDLLLQQWQLTEEELFEKTRQLYAKGQGYQPRSQGEELQDWS